MHVKYAFLHFSYSAPVRVCDIADDEDCVAARETTLFVVRCCVPTADVRVVAVLAAAGCGVTVAVRAAFCRTVAAAPVRGTVTAVRAFCVFCVVARCRNTVAAAAGWLRVVTFPSRTAAPAGPNKIKPYNEKIRMFFISVKNISKKAIFRAREIIER